jgi:predicted MFS family arabinose efflux permease
MFAAGSWPCILLLYVYGLVATSLVTQSVPVIGDIAHAFGVPISSAGWIISIPSLVTAIAAMGGGWLSDNVGDRRVIFWGCLCAFMGNLGVFFAQEYTVLMAFRLLEGVGYLALTVGAVTMIMRTTQGSRRSIALGLWTSHTSCGIGLTLILVAPLAQKGDAWRWAFGGHAVIMAVLAAASVFLPKMDPNHVSRRFVDIATVLRSRGPWRIAIASCASAFIQTGIMAALTVYLARTYSVSIPVAAGVGFGAEIVNALGCLSVGVLLKNGWSARVLALGGGVVMLLGGLALYAPDVSFAAAGVATAVFGFGIGIVNGLIWAMVPSVSPSRETLGATGGLVAQATYLGVLLGPPAIFATMHAQGWTTRLMLVAGACVVQLLPLPIWGRRARNAIGITPVAH